MNQGESQTLFTESGDKIEAVCLDFDNQPKGGRVFRLRDPLHDLERHVTIEVTSLARKMAEARGFADKIDLIIWNFLQYSLNSGAMRLGEDWDPWDRKWFQIRSEDLDWLRTYSRPNVRSS